jgi:hypothetical protein
MDVDSLEALYTESVMQLSLLLITAVIITGPFLLLTCTSQHTMDHILDMT